ncbi:MAG: TRAP transporter small permease [Chloroflexi bacterium]|nr:TRAP transporter small permease [Chloroflexota bacterium]
MSAKAVDALEKGARTTGTILTLEKVVTKTSDILNAIGMGMLLVLVLLGTADVVGRYFFSKPIIGAQEMGSLLLAGMVFMSWGYTYITRGHAEVDFVLPRFPRRAQRLINLATTLFSLVLFALITWQGIEVAGLYHAGGRLVYVIDLPLAPFQLLVSLGAVVVCLALLVEILKLLCTRREDS